MKTMPRVLIVLLLAGAVAGTLMLKNQQSATNAQAEANEAATMPGPEASAEKTASSDPVNVAKAQEPQPEPVLPENLSGTDWRVS